MHSVNSKHNNNSRSARTIMYSSYTYIKLVIQWPGHRTTSAVRHGNKYKLRTARLPYDPKLVASVKKEDIWPSCDHLQ